MNLALLSVNVTVQVLQLVRLGCQTDVGVNFPGPIRFDKMSQYKSKQAVMSPKLITFVTKIRCLIILFSNLSY